MIDTVIFDIGRVLVGFEWMPYIHGILDDEQDIEAVNNAIWKSGLWTEQDRGVMSHEEIYNGMLKLAPGREDKLTEVFTRSGECIKRLDYAIPWIEEMNSRGLNTLFLSNYSRFMMKNNWNALDFLPYLDGGIFSCDVKLIKPDPEIYKCIRDKYNLDFSKCVFIDDNPNNADSAEKCGLHTIRFDNYEQAHRELNELLSE